MNFITVITTRGQTGKEAFINEAGEIEFRSLGSNIAGRAETIHCDSAESLADLLAELKPNQYITPDFIPEAVSQGVEYELVTGTRYGGLFGMKHTDPGFGALREMDGTFYAAKVMTPDVWCFGAWRLFDIDVDSQTPEKFRSMSVKKWFEYMDTLIPDFSKSEYVVAGSSKSRVCFTGKPETAKASTNAHVFVLCSNTHMTDRVRSSAKVMASEKGLSWQKLNKLGHKSTALIFDTAVFTLHRDCYEAPPSLADERLELLPRVLNTHKGEPLDLDKAFPAMTVDRVTASSITTGKFKLDSKGNISEREYDSLVSDTVIELEDKAISVHDFVASDEYACNVKYRCQTAFRDSTSWNGILRKYIDGRVMHYDQGTGISHWTAVPVWQPAADAFRRSAEQGEAKKQAATKTLGIVLSALSPDEFEIYSDDIKARTKITKGKLKALRKAGKEFKHQTDAYKEFTRQIASMQAARIEAAKIATTRKDITELRTYEDASAELSANWFLILNQNETNAATFFFEVNNYGFHELKFMTYKLGALKTFLKNTDEITDFGRRSAVEDWTDKTSRVGVRSVTFEPGLERHFDGKLNLWTGWGIEPAKESNGCELFLSHVHEVIAAGDQTVYDYLLGWMATVVQRIYNRTKGKPLARTEIIIVLRSIQGTGKGLFEQYFAKLFGIHALTTSKGHEIAGRFNWKFANQLLICADEAFFAGDHATYDAMKAFATDPFFDFEKKFQDSVTLPNHVSMIMSSNKDWVTPAELRDRRMCVLDVSDCHVGDADYFGALVDEMQGGGPEALFRYLLDYDLSTFNIRLYPRTEALASQVVQTLARDNALYGWLDDVLESGEMIVPQSWRRREVEGCYYEGTGESPFEVYQADDGQTAVENDLSPFMDESDEDEEESPFFESKSPEDLDGDDLVIQWPMDKPLKLPRGLMADMINSTTRNHYAKRSNKQLGIDLRAIGLIDGGRERVTVNPTWGSYGIQRTGIGQQMNAWLLPPRRRAIELFKQHLQGVEETPF